MRKSIKFNEKETYKVFYCVRVFENNMSTTILTTIVKTT